MSFELRPSSNAVFSERLRNAEARKEKELKQINRRPRIKDRRKAEIMRVIEIKKELLEVKHINKEIWGD